MLTTDVLDVLQSSGPMALNELAMRSSQEPGDIAKRLETLQLAGKIVVTGPHAHELGKLTFDQIMAASDTFVELSWSTLRRSFAS